MKKIILLLVVLFTATVLAQQPFPCRKPELTIGKKIKVTPLNDVQRQRLDSQYPFFYSDSNLSTFYKGATGTKENLLSGKIFTVTNVETLPNKFYRYTLQNDTEGILYYKQYQDVIANIELLEPVDFPEDYYDLFIKADKISTTLIEYKAETGVLSYIFCDKFVRKGEPDSYIMSIKAGINPIPNPKGVQIDFDNGQSIKRPDVKFEGKASNGGGGAAFCVFELTKAELELLTNHKIVYYKYVNMDKNVRTEEGHLIMNIFKRLTTKTL